MSADRDGGSGGTHGAPEAARLSKSLSPSRDPITSGPSTTSSALIGAPTGSACTNSPVSVSHRRSTPSSPPVATIRQPARVRRCRSRRGTRHRPYLRPLRLRVRMGCAHRTLRTTSRIHRRPNHIIDPWHQRRSVLDSTTRSPPARRHGRAPRSPRHRHRALGPPQRGVHPRTATGPVHAVRLVPRHQPHRPGHQALSRACGAAVPRRPPRSERPRSGVNLQWQATPGRFRAGEPVCPWFCGQGGPRAHRMRTRGRTRCRPAAEAVRAQSGRAVPRVPGRQPRHG